MNTRLLVLSLALAACGGRTVASEGVGAETDASAPLDAHADAPGADAPWKDTGKDAAPAQCEPQDAAPDGTCDMILPGVRWDGSHCVLLGSGCSCKGADCGALYASMADCVSARFWCYPDACQAHEVASNTCTECFTHTYEGTAYTGRDCRDLVGCECVGAGCSMLFRSNEECVAVTSQCSPALCQATGGQWFPASQFCGFRCGGPDMSECFAPFEDCLCPLGQTFAILEGCQPDATCTNEDFCKATGGQWHPMSECYCGFHCGQPGDCEACADSCDCGPARNFAGPTGCVLDQACVTSDAKALCTSTGGTWMDCDEGPCSCGDYVCGQPNTMDPCVMPGCDCGVLRNFDATLGCRLDQTCTLKGEGAACFGYGLENYTCAPGLACCGHCGVAPGCNSCDSPCCPDDPNCQNGCWPPPP